MIGKQRINTLKIKLSLSLLLLIFLSGCASLLPQGSSKELQQQLNQLNNWQARGKLSVVSPDSSHTGYLTWKQQKQAYDLYISGPFGAGASRLQGDQQQASLLIPGWKEPQYASSAEELMLLHTGWNFPVSQIRYWVKGQPIPKSRAKTQFNDNGLLDSLEQHGWTVRYARYQQQNGYWLPGLIRISGHDFRFTFAIKEWTLYE